MAVQAMSARAQSPGAHPANVHAAGLRQLLVEAKAPTRLEQREKRHYRVRNKVGCAPPMAGLPAGLPHTALTRCLRCHPQVSGTTERPRLAVFRSNSNIYAQVRDTPRTAARGRSWPAGSPARAAGAHGPASPGVRR